MNAPLPPAAFALRGIGARAIDATPLIARSKLAGQLRRHTQGEVLFDAASRGRYSTDASIYQIEPVGVFVPKTEGDVRMACNIARELRVRAVKLVREAPATEEPTALACDPPFRYTPDGRKIYRIECLK